ncbi:MAG TPA: pyridoxamine 5'-phosphate oxidase [Flavobacteriales bacterium]|jgi:pyridoxamine 5'-phosphate oxidase|nr:pyridoxamine 5'-phosphate oxidase [Flavobacteriales bacterium]
MIEEVSNFLNEIRHDFSSRPLNMESVLDNPMEQYAQWFEEAVGSQILDPKAMVLTTVNSRGVPSSRVLYARGITREGFIFYTNYNSRKAKEMEENPFVCVNIHWPELERQIRASGKIEKVKAEVSDKYFSGRPRASQIGAWASDQSDKLSSREELEKKVEEFEKKFRGRDVPRPPHWGGYFMKVDYFEFWQGRAARLHDRIVYDWNKESRTWDKHRISP